MELRPAKTWGIASSASADWQAWRMRGWVEGGRALACVCEGMEVCGRFRDGGGGGAVGDWDGTGCGFAALVGLGFVCLSSVRLVVGGLGFHVVFSTALR